MINAQGGRELLQPPINVVDFTLPLILSKDERLKKARELLLEYGWSESRW